MKSKIKYIKEVVKLSSLKQLKKNPRRISERKLNQLAESVKEFEQMLDIREIVIDEDNVVIGGNQRFKALKQNKTKEITVLRVVGLSDEQKDEFTIKDNVNYGVFDWDILANHHDTELLNKYGLNVWEPSDGYDDDDTIITTTHDEEVSGEGTGELQDLEDKDCVVVIDFYSNDYDTAKVLLDDCRENKKDIAELLYQHLNNICNG